MIDARRALGVGAALCALVLTGCTSDKAADPPSPSPTPASQTPTETAQERQERLDYAAAEKSYRTFRAEYNRVLRAGGAKEPTKVMKATAGGDYLATLTTVIRGFDLLGSRSTGRERIVFVRGVGYGATSLELQVCEDDRQLRTVRKSGKSGAGDLRAAQLELRKVSGAWKVWSGNGEVVTACG